MSQKEVHLRGSMKRWMICSGVSLSPGKCLFGDEAAGRLLISVRPMMPSWSKLKFRDVRPKTLISQFMAICLQSAVRKGRKKSKKRKGTTILSDRTAASGGTLTWQAMLTRKK